jgi:hypothetical protein
VEGKEIAVVGSDDGLCQTWPGVVAQSGFVYISCGGEEQRDNSKYATAGSHFGIVVATGLAVAVGNGRAETLT